MNDNSQCHPDHTVMPEKEKITIFFQKMLDKCVSAWYNNFAVLKTAGHMDINTSSLVLGYKDFVQVLC